MKMKALQLSEDYRERYELKSNEAAYLVHEKFIDECTETAIYFIDVFGEKIRDITSEALGLFAINAMRALNVFVDQRLQQKSLKISSTMPTPNRLNRTV